MKDFCRHVRAANGQLVSLSGRVKEWEDLSEYERKEITELLAKMLLEDYLHPRPYCRFCLRDDCPALKNEGECPAERPLRWLPSDRPRKRATGRRRRAAVAGSRLDLQRFLDRL